ncbi:hypothetical protein MTR67_038618 [Solanum verrucosum]|uniref:Copia protein n=1 Tax=Solanum verrucosum TaxID=315347 RepID=A0AAF0UFI7_SOLVR|nr:hypothetical protein MTR67_038618 [Solanum verrucosum]
MLGCQPIDTPIEQNHSLEELPDQVPTNKARYQRLVGCLIYLSHTRPYIAYAKSKKQKVISLSSVETEYRAMVKGIQELLWLKRLMGEFSFSLDQPMKLFCDNQFAIKIAENPIQHDCTKHVEIDCNFIYEKFEDKTIEVPYVKTLEQLADVLTKVVSRKAFITHLSRWAYMISMLHFEGEC